MSRPDSRGDVDPKHPGHLISWIIVAAIAGMVIWLFVHRVF